MKKDYNDTNKSPLALESKFELFTTPKYVKINAF